MEEFNIAEALKYAPKGLKLYSPIFGQVQLYKIKHKGYIELEYDNSESTLFSPQGKFYSNKGECLLFPSEDHRTWDNWQNILLPQSVGSVCVYPTGALKPTMFLCTFDGTVFSDNSSCVWDVLIEQGGSFLKSSHYASPEESKQFFAKLKVNGYEWNGKDVIKTIPTLTFNVGDEQCDILFEKMKEASYEWDANKKELRKLQPDKFDITTLKPFGKVLVRDNEDDIWTPDFYSFYSGDTNLLSRFNTITDAWKCCIPYNDDTKHLIGKNDDAPEFYKTW